MKVEASKFQFKLALSWRKFQIWILFLNERPLKILWRAKCGPRAANDLLIILLFLGRNFWTRNARTPIKGLKDSDSSLVSYKKFSQTIPSSSWSPGLGNLNQNSQKPIPLW